MRYWAWTILWVFAERAYQRFSHWRLAGEILAEAGWQCDTRRFL